jgi:hypothetical protein
VTLATAGPVCKFAPAFENIVLSVLPQSVEANTSNLSFFEKKI